MNRIDTLSPLSKTIGEAAGSLIHYMELTKPRLTLLAVLTTLLGFYMGSWLVVDLPLLLVTMVGAALVGFGANALNQYLERETDAKMKRTQNRPLPTGRLQPEQALFFGIILSVAGILVLAFFVNLLTSLLAVITLTTYLFVYTPLKKRSPLCTLAGAIPGAIPPLIGWTAVRGELGLEAWILFSILFLWQLPHFLAIGWVCREEYARAGFPMLMVLDSNGKSTTRQILLYCLALLPVTLIPSILRMSGIVYFGAVLFLGAILAGLSLFLCLTKEKDFHARKFFLTTILYLFVLIIFMMSDKI